MGWLELIKLLLNVRTDQIYAVLSDSIESHPDPGKFTCLAIKIRVYF